MSYIVMIKRGETSLGFSRGSGCEAVATALSLIRNGEVDVSITSPRGVIYKPTDFRLLISDLVEVDRGLARKSSSFRYEEFGQPRVKQHAHRH
jgi:hypothetical protein